MTPKSKSQPVNELAAYLSSFETFETHGQGPSWLNAIHRAGISHFAELGFPTVRQEDWIYTNVAPIQKLPFKPVRSYSPDGVTAQNIEPFSFGGMNCHRLVFVNGHYSKELSSVSPRTDGVKIGSLAQAVTTEPKILESNLSRYARVDENGFSALNAAFFQDGAFVFVPAGKTVDEPIHLLFVSSGDEAGRTAHPRNLIVVQSNGRAKIIEHYVSAGSAPQFTNALTEIVVSDGANLEHCKFQNESLDAFHVATIQANLGRSSHFTSHSISTGARIARNNINLVLAGEGIDCVMNGLYLVGGKQLVDHHTIADHAQPHCGSHEFYHGILGGQARGVFNGKILVRKDAQKTDAKQTNRNLLLSDTATVDTKPQLEIFADDVKCTHGATVGQLNEEAIFYFRSRGIDEATAKRMLTHAFASEIVNRITIEPVREYLEKFLLDRLEENTRIAERK